MALVFDYKDIRSRAHGLDCISEKEPIIQQLCTHAYGPDKISCPAACFRKEIRTDPDYTGRKCFNFGGKP